MRINFGKIFQEASKDKRMDGLVNIPSDKTLWPPAWTEIQYKTYERFQRIVLPHPEPRIFGHKELIKRKSVRNFHGNIFPSVTKGANKITLSRLSNILYFSCGETESPVGHGRKRRIQASAGARYPNEVYVLNFEKGDLDTWCYHYNVKEHSLEALWDVGITEKKEILGYFSDEWCPGASMAIVLTAVPNRSVMKYGERGYRYTYLEAGAILQNIQNNAMLEDLGSTMCGGTNEKSIEQLLDLDGVNETVILGILLG